MLDKKSEKLKELLEKNEVGVNFQGENQGHLLTSEQSKGPEPVAIGIERHCLQGLYWIKLNRSIEFAIDIINRKIEAAVARS